MLKAFLKALHALLFISGDWERTIPISVRDLGFCGINSSAFVATLKALLTYRIRRYVCEGELRMSCQDLMHLQVRLYKALEDTESWEVGTSYTSFFQSTSPATK